MQDDIIEPVNLSIKDAVRISGISRSELYRRLAAPGNGIRAVKLGRTTLICWQSLRSYLATLPAATFRAPSQAAA